MEENCSKLVLDQRLITPNVWTRYTKSKGKITSEYELTC